MDHGRKIGKMDLPFSWPQRPSPPSSICDKTTLIEEEEITEDRRLVNWRKWLDVRKKHYQHYEKYTRRDRQDLLMIKDVDDFRQKVEIKSLIEGADNLIPPTTDKYRGDPAFWVTPEFLSKHGNPDLPDISVTLTRKQVSAKPLIERVALPELIRQEKGLPVSSKREASWRCSDYLRIREKKLSREMKLLEAREPETSQLAIKGRRLEPGAGKKSSKISVITIKESKTFETENNESESTNDVEHDRAIVMTIQDREITLEAMSNSLRKTNEQCSDRFTWSLIFNSTDHEPSEREIRLENRGNCAVTYRWRYGLLDTSFVPPLPRNSPFFFNKNKGLVLPRQVVRLRVWFRSRVPCTATEFWTLKTEPPISREPLIFRFWGSAILSKSPSDSSKLETTIGHSVNPESIESYLNRRIRDAKIHEIVQSILDNVQRNNLPSVSYKSLFVESEIFRGKNPTYFCHSGLLRELRDIYDDVTSNDSPSWSLSLTDLRGVLLMMKDSSVRNEAMNRFNESCRESLRPVLYNPIGDAKRSMVYNLLCSLANKFETESDHVANKCFQMDISTGRTSNEAPGDVSRSTSVTTISQVSLTPRRRTRKISRSGQSRTMSRTTSRTSISIPTNNRDTNMDDTSEKKATKKCLLYREVFRVRIREMLSNTIAEICAVIDTMDNLNPREK